MKERLDQHPIESSLIAENGEKPTDHQQHGHEGGHPGKGLVFQLAEDAVQAGDDQRPSRQPDVEHRHHDGQRGEHEGQQVERPGPSVYGFVLDSHFSASRYSPR